MKFLYKDDIPCYYELSWEKKLPAIKIRVHKDFVKNAVIISQTAPMILDLCQEFGFQSFSGSLNGNFGFNNSFVLAEESDNFIEFLIEIPWVKKETSEHCNHCNGSKRDRELHCKCLWCQGTGREGLYDWKGSYAISASFNVLFTLLRSPEEETSSHLFQLMEVSTITRKGMHGGSLGGTFSPPLCNWMDSLRESGKSSIIEMVEAMRLAHNVMMGLNSDEFDFRASVDYEGGWLNTSCPGNACGLNPSHMGPEKGLGYRLECHNVDTPAQQLELIAGLAALHDKARKEMEI